MFALTIVCAALTAEIPGEQRYGQGHLLERNARYADAMNAFQEVADMDSPLKYHAAVRSAAARGAAGDLDGARELLQYWSRELPEGGTRAFALWEYGRVLQQAAAHADAVAALSGALVPDLELWWQFDVRWALAENKIRVPGRTAEGWAFFGSAVTTAVWPRERLAAADLIIQATDREAQLAAADTLLWYDRYREAADLIARLQQDTTPGSEEAGQLAWLRARALLGLQQIREARELLETTARLFEGGTWGRVAMGLLARDYQRKGEFERAEAAIQQLEAAYPGADEAAEVRWHLAAAYKRRQDFADALRHYMHLASAYPRHRFADDSLMEAGHIHEDAGRRDAAREAWEALFERYPASDLAVETALHLGDLERAAGRDADALKYYRIASGNGIGNYYGHKAAQRRREMRDSGLPAARELPIAPGTVLVRPTPVGQLMRDPVSPKYRDDERLQRLRFFALHGMPEAEWEALYLLDEARSQPAPLEMYLAVGETGIAYSPMQLAAAQRYGEGDNGIQSPDRLRIRYPRAYWDYVSELGAESGIDPYLILSIARQESTYRPALTSHAGASGVLQLMPATAEWLVDIRDEIDHRHIRNLQDPSNSFRLGTYYLKYLLERYEGNYVYSIAAYNGGPGNVNKWRREIGNVPLDEFIERIPFTETRNYVKRVLANWAAYHSLYEPAG